MRKFLSERNLVVVLFVLVLVTYSLAQEDSKKMEQMYSGINSTAGAAHLMVSDQTTKQAEDLNPAPAQ